MAETWSAVLRGSAWALEEIAVAHRQPTPPQVTHLRALADLLARVTPEMRHEVATLAGSLPRQAAMRGLRDVLTALAAGPQGEEGRDE